SPWVGAFLPHVAVSPLSFMGGSLLAKNRDGRLSAQGMPWEIRHGSTSEVRGHLTGPGCRAGLTPRLSCRGRRYDVEAGETSMAAPVSISRWLGPGLILDKASRAGLGFVRRGGVVGHTSE